MKLTKIVLTFGLALSLCACAPAEVATHQGPQCTLAYPQGFEVEKDVEVCTNGEFGSTWRMCELRYRA